MAMQRCPICGEKYSETYRDCPFCEEDEALREGEEIRRNVRGGKRVSGGRRFSLITPTLILLILLMAGLLIYLLRDDKDTDAPEKPPVEDVTPDSETQKPDEETQKPDDGEQTQPEEDSSGVMPEDDGTVPVVPDEPDDSEEPEVPDESDDGTNTEYETAAKLPNGLSLNKTDFTLGYLGETYTLRVSGGSGSGYQWISEDDGIASVDQNGKVTAVSGGMTNVLVTDGNKKAVCIVRVSASGTLTPAPDSGSSSSSSSGNSGSSGSSSGSSSNSDSTSSSTSGPKAGAAVVVNGGNGVRVRSGPGTNYEILASVPNGADIRVVKSAGDGWYEITFDNVGGVKTTGYMKGDYLKNK